MSETDNINLDYRIKVIIVIILIIPIFFGFNREFIFPSNVSLVELIIIILGIIFLLIFGILFITPFFKTQHFEKMKKHEVVKVFINKNYKPLYRSFLLSMIIDEMIFRFYIAGILIQCLEMINLIILSSIIFSAYHIYIWFYLKDLRILCVYLVYAFFLGLLNALIFFHLGLIFCIVIHYGLVLTNYWKIYKQG